MLHSPAVVTRHWRCTLTTVVLLALAIGCGKGGTSRTFEASRNELPSSNVVAMVDDSPISLEALNRALSGSAMTPRQALETLLGLRAYALHARNGGLERGRFQMTERSILGRAFLEGIEERSSEPPEPTDAEIAAMTERRWIDFDRPVTVTTCHAIVHSERMSESTGMALAVRLRDALRSATTCDDFLDRARRFPAAGAKITAERLPPVTPQGRTLILDEKGIPVDEGDTFDSEFARAAHEISGIGAQSDVVRTAFGWHVILLESRLPAHSVGFDERRRLLRTDILKQRAKDACEGVLRDLRRSTTISVERSAIETAGRVQVAP